MRSRALPMPLTVAYLDPYRLRLRSRNAEILFNDEDVDRSNAEIGDFFTDPLESGGFRIPKALGVSGE